MKLTVEAGLGALRRRTSEWCRSHTAIEELTDVVADACDASDAYFILIDAQGLILDPVGGRNWDERKRSLFHERYAHINPLMPRATRALQQGLACTNDDLMSRRQYYSTEFYTDFIRPELGHVHEIGTVVEAGHGQNWLIFLSRQRRERAFDDRSRQLICGARGPLRDAMAYRRAHAFSLALSNAIPNRQPMSAIVGFDRLGRVVFVDGGLIESLSDAGSVIQRRDGLHFDGAAHEVFRHALRRALHAPFGLSGKHALPIPNVSLTVQFVRVGTSQLEVESGAAVWAFFESNIESLDLRIHALRRRFGLTMREQAVARLLAQGASTEEIAAALSISNATCRVHIRSLLGKTEARRRDALVALIHGAETTSL
jgi:DNA-binding CsgD family transcriptional regulator